MTKIAIVTMSDRASQGIYEDKSGKEIEKFLSENITNDYEIVYRLIPDDYDTIVKTLKELVDMNCSLILTTGGTGPAPRDVTPEATKEVIEKELPGFGELMRMHSLKYVPTSILARGTAGVVKKSFILNLPGSPKAIKENLEAVWAAIPYAIDLIGGNYIESPTAFRPKKK
ncbi:molybdopterin adenylyltransferase [Caminibacter pacificus]|uniref:Molybdopterin adenylyltransferase n=1 Tax=Caminibacter pacificus TaxID=1424653 RepID=A0AAJ4REE1_9BACT|nr:molybdopterin adenylyltransferase [Caminibacter pacificus]QCI28230.1 molybdopterin adenylyltransferase [Caminibacter pacificus]ROR41056.1 molybdopterin adenylyltransferase [Caminibacter pacificus]